MEVKYTGATSVPFTSSVPKTEILSHVPWNLIKVPDSTVSLIPAGTSQVRNDVRVSCIQSSIAGKRSRNGSRRKNERGCEKEHR